MERRDPRDQLAVQLLGERARVVLRVRSPASTWTDRDAQVERRERGGESRRGVAVDERGSREPLVTDHGAGRDFEPCCPEPLAAERVEPGDDRGDELVQAQPGMADSEIDVGHDLAQLEDRVDQIAVLPGRDDDRLEPGAPRSASTTGSILIASGRVPIRTRTWLRVSSSNTATSREGDATVRHRGRKPHRSNG